MKDSKTIDAHIIFDTTNMTENLKGPLEVKFIRYKND